MRNIFSGLIEDVDVQGSNAAAAKTTQPARTLLSCVEHLPGFTMDVEFFLHLKKYEGNKKIMLISQTMMNCQIELIWK